jgi:hypothetical protein
LSYELMIGEEANDRRDVLISRVVGPILAQLVDASWPRREYTASGTPGTGLGAAHILANLDGAIAGWLDEIAERARVASFDVTSAYDEKLARPPSTIGELMDDAGLHEQDSEIHMLTFNPQLRLAPLMVLGALAQLCPDLLLHTLELHVLTERRVNTRSRLPYVWQRARIGCRAEALVLDAFVTINGKPAHVPVGLRTLPRPDVNEAETSEQTIARLAGELLSDAGDATRRLRQSLQLDAAAALDALPLIVRGPMAFGFPTLKTSRPTGPLSHRLTPGISRELIATVMQHRADAAFECSDRLPDGIEAASGTLLMSSRRGVAAIDHRCLAGVAKHLNALDPDSPRVRDIHKSLGLEDVTSRAQSGSRLVQWLMSTAALVRGVKDTPIRVLPVLRLPRAEGPSSVWLLCGSLRAATLAALERRVGARATAAFEDCVARRYRRRACISLRLNAGVRPELREGVEAAHQVANLLYICLAFELEP